MYCRSARVWPPRPMSRPDSSVFTSSIRPSSAGCSSTVAGTPSSSSSFSRVALGCADIPDLDCVLKVSDYGSGLFLLFRLRRQCGRNLWADRRHRLVALGELGLQDRKQVLHG